MENKIDKFALNDELLDRVSGGKTSCYGTTEVPDDVFCPRCGGDQMLLNLGYGLYECVAPGCGIAFDLNGNIYTPQ